MTLQQLEYIVALDTHRHFVTAARHCFVTQATLSMMIRKLEDELGVRLFDRSRQPVAPTPIGVALVAQARLVLQEARRLTELVSEEQGTVSGELRLGVIPTLAPYLLPRFLPALMSEYPALQVRVTEANTGELIERLEAHTLDAALLATPLERPTLTELPLFYERFYVYAAPEEKLPRKGPIHPDDIDPDRLWLLSEGHCLRTQVLQLCGGQTGPRRLAFETGSLEMLLRLIDTQGGLTIVPELAIDNLSARQQKNVRPFRNPAPVREISLVTSPHYARRKVVEILSATVRAHLPESLRERFKKQVLAPL
ncbi:hydrogen peroxide-inducible genes activator [Flaviaesturariibacter aridisoli]|uniref:Hydrogen peroxide-inducible genes activator n=1 Tax=Flaviaesturariibacter aridisoli TaxID=2545761 RepID=A0A4R4E7N2_9BACT|nr:hydrogen peroxide-inducible genes activator [Flaviaesturariibacter aridisoli]TCZ73735.1 hydrogen peroxide-inducible genes activator [Flaviaesturariibacter aridisoli]